MLKAMIRKIIFVVSLIGLSSVNAESVVKLKYTTKPIKISLVTKKEKQITFPAAVWAEIPNKLKNKLKTMIVGNNVYFTAIKPFKSERIILGEEVSNQIYLFDLRAGPSGNVNVRDINARFLIENAGDRFDPKHLDNESKIGEALRPGIKRPGYASLIKYAARELYAPDRLRGGIPGVARATLPKRRVHHLIRGHSVRTDIWASWRGANNYVTAVKLKNNNKSSIILDPRDVRGGWKAVAFQHTKLGPKGSDLDTTALYVVSERPFFEVMRGTAIDVRN